MRGLALLCLVLLWGWSPLASAAPREERRPELRRAALAAPAATARPVARGRKASAAVPRARAVSKPRPVAVRRAPAARPTVAHLAGLHQALDPLALKSAAALVVDSGSREVLVAKNADAVLPIASLTKLMTSLVVLESGQPLDEMLSIGPEDIDTEKGSTSRLQPGTQLSRSEMLHLALMSSENRAANALGRHHPGGLPSFVRAMNAKAIALGMHDTRYVEPTGLSSQNRSSARDLARLVDEAARHPLISELSVSPEHAVSVGPRALQYRNTNGLVRNPEWDVLVQKTGYIAEAGRCLVMKARLAGRELVMIFLDSAGKHSRIGDAERVRRWVESQPRPAAAPAARPALPPRPGPVALPATVDPLLAPEPWDGDEAGWILDEPTLPRLTL